MKTIVHCKNIERAQNLTDYLVQEMDHCVAKFESWRSLAAEIFIKAVRNRPEKSHSIFSFELVLSGKGLPRPIIIVKKSQDLHHAMRECLQIAESLLGKNAKMRVAKRRGHSRLRDAFREVAA